MTPPDRRLPCAVAIATGAVSAFGFGDDATRAAVLGEPARVALRPDPALTAAGLLRPNAARAPAALPLSWPGLLTAPPSPPLPSAPFFVQNAADFGAISGVLPRDAACASDATNPSTPSPDRSAPAGPRDASTLFPDRAAALLACAFDQLVRSLDSVRPGWRDARIGIALGTSSGGMLTAERFFAARAAGEGREQLAPLARGATYFAPVDAVLDAYRLAHVGRRTLILAACAASTIAIGLGTRWLDRDACDLVIAGGFDALSVFVACGFEALRATTATLPRPFKKGRDGMSLGEGAALVALVRGGDERGARPRLHVSGFGASTDAVHITAPDATGGGLARAALAALRDAGVTSAELVSAHGTATPYNDAMEAKAIRAAIPGRPVVHPFKAQIGHTLGAAGVLETLAAADALARGVAPAATSEGEPDPETDVCLLPRSEARRLAHAIKLSAAFGGSNAALVLAAAAESRPPRPRRPVFVAAGAHITECDLAALAESTGVARDRLARLDTLCRLGLSAVAALAATATRERLAGAGIVAGHALATLDTNDAFDAKKRSRGPSGVEPRLFPATSPNALPGECAIVYKLTGPSFAVGAGLDGATEALLDAAELIAAGDAERMVVVAADDAGPVARDLLDVLDLAQRPFARGAIALLLTTGEADGAPSGRPVPLPSLPDHHAGPMGHLALLPWLPASRP